MKAANEEAWHFVLIWAFGVRAGAPLHVFLGISVIRNAD